MTESTPQVRLYPSFWQAVLILVLVVAAMLGMQLALEMMGRMLKLPITQHPVALAFIEFTAIGLALVVQRKTVLAPLRRSFTIAGLQPAYFVAITVTILGATVLISEVGNYMLRLIPPPRSFIQMAEGLVTGRVSLMGSLLALVIVAPLMEELLFRGVILRGFLTRFNVPVAIVLSSVLFGLFHMNPWQLPGATALGALFGWWFARTGSLVPGIFGHAFNNGMLLLASLAVPDIQGYTTSPLEPQFQPLWFDMLGVIVTASGLWLSVQLLKGPQTDNIQRPQELSG